MAAIDDGRVGQARLLPGNALVVAWPEIARLAARPSTPGPVQAGIL